MINEKSFFEFNPEIEPAFLKSDQEILKALQLF